MIDVVDAKATKNSAKTINDILEKYHLCSEVAPTMATFDSHL